MIILQCSDVYLERALLEGPDAPPVFTTREEHPLDPPPRIQGLCRKSFLGRPILFFRDEELLYLRHGDDPSIALAEDVTAEHSVAGTGERRLVLRRGDKILLDLSYPESELEEWWPTAFRDDEDLDFGLFIHNVLVDPDRRERIWRLSME